MTTLGVAVVTGAARGLGRAIAVEPHRLGYTVHLTDTDVGGVTAAGRWP